MRSKCLFILVLITGICFVLSAWEINTDSIKNTFDDEYDHYIQPDNTQVQATVVQFAQDDLPLLATWPFEPHRYAQTISLQNCPPNHFVFPIKHPPKIYLLYRLLKI
jgi:hypothetical protein